MAFPRGGASCGAFDAGVPHPLRAHDNRGIRKFWQEVSSLSCRHHRRNQDFLDKVQQEAHARGLQERYQRGLQGDLQRQYRLHVLPELQGHT